LIYINKEKRVKEDERKELKRKQGNEGQKVVKTIKEDRLELTIRRLATLIKKKRQINETEDNVTGRRKQKRGS
jgi:hypothetical protein